MLYVKYVVKNRKVSMTFVDKETLSKLGQETIKYRKLFGEGPAYSHPRTGPEYDRRNLIDVIFRDQFKGYEFEVIDRTKK